MPLNDFFTYDIDRQEAGIISARVRIKANHPVFDGHFPGQPITPGVALIEIIRQVLSYVLNKKLMLTEAREIKFIAAVIPAEMKEIELSVEYNESPAGVSATCIFSGKGTVFTKLKGDFSAG
jgi:3-hydroxyacyl-[acyl-carrier-protein] dehydratase